MRLFKFKTWILDCWICIFRFWLRTCLAWEQLSSVKIFFHPVYCLVYSKIFFMYVKVAVFPFTSKNQFQNIVSQFVGCFTKLRIFETCPWFSWLRRIWKTIKRGLQGTKLIQVELYFFVRNTMSMFENFQKQLRIV